MATSQNDPVLLAQRSERLWQIISAILITVLLAGGGFIWETRVDLAEERLNREFLVQRMSTLEQTIQVYQANYVEMGKDLTAMKSDLQHMGTDIDAIEAVVNNRNRR